MAREPHVHLMPTADGRFDALTAFELTGLGACDSDEARTHALHRQEEFLGSLVDLRHDRWFELDYLGLPSLSEPWKSRARISLVLGCRGASAAEARKLALASHAAVRQSLPHDTGLHEFSDVRDEKSFAALWHPFESLTRVEFARRVGPASDAALRLNGFEGCSPEFGSLPRALLSAHCAARVRLVFRPTRLFPWESLALERLLEGPEGNGALPRATGPLGALVRSRDQLLLTRILVESTIETPPGILAALATDVAGSGHGWTREASGMATGAFDVVPLPSAGADDLPLPGHASPDEGSDPADGLGRVRHLFSVDLAARIFRIPIPREPIFGLPSRRSRLVLAPPEIPNSGFMLGRNGSLSDSRPIAIPDDARARHLYTLGQTGTGKSTFLFHLIMQDIRAGRGVCVIDPHGDLVEKVMANMPDERIGDVALFDPTDDEHPVGFNPLDVTDPLERDLVCEGLLALFERMWPPEFVGPIFQHNVRNAVRMMFHLADLGHIPAPPSLLSLPRFLGDRPLLRKLQTRVTDPAVRVYLDQAVTDSALRKEVVEHVVSKFNVLLSNSRVRNMIGRRDKQLNIERVIEEGRVFLVRLPTGQLGELTARFLGFLLLSRVQNVILARAERPRESRRDYYVYVDEFQNFLTESFTILLAEGRKFGVNMVIANQFLGQLEDKNVRQRILGAIFGNVGTIVAFRVGHEDADEISRQFGPTISRDDFTSLPNFHAYARTLSQGGAPVSLSLRATPATQEDQPVRAAKCRQSSRDHHASPVAEARREIQFEQDSLDAIMLGLPGPKHPLDPTVKSLEMSPAITSSIEIAGIRYVSQIHQMGMEWVKERAKLDEAEARDLAAKLGIPAPESDQEEPQDPPATAVTLPPLNS